MNDKERTDLIKYRIEKAKNTLTEIDVLIRNEFFYNAVNRLYYSCFYAVSALLLYREIQSKTHAGTRQMFGMHFIKPGIISNESGDYYTFIFEMRQTGDYDDYFEFERDEVIALIQPAKKLVSEIEEILKRYIP